MKKIIRLNEDDLTRIVRRVIKEQSNITSSVVTPDVVENYFKKNVYNVIDDWASIEDLKKLYSMLLPLSGKTVKGISKCFFYHLDNGEKQSKPINTTVLNYINSLNAKVLQDQCNRSNSGPEYYYLYDEISAVGTVTLGKEGDLMKKKLLDLLTKNGVKKGFYFNEYTL